MNFQQKLSEILKDLQDSVMHTAEPYIHQTEFDEERIDAQAAITDLVLESLPMLKLAEYSMHGQRAVIDENMGWNRAIEVVRKQIEGGK